MDAPKMAIVPIMFPAVAGYFLLRVFLNLPHDNKEPQLIPQNMPFIRHLIVMIREGSGYYGMITYDASLQLSTQFMTPTLTCRRKRLNLPLYTLRVPWGKIYIVNSPDLISMVDRHSKTISFAPYVVHFAKMILVLSRATVSALEENMLQTHDGLGLRPETLNVMHDSLIKRRVRDQNLLLRVRNKLREHLGGEHVIDINPKNLSELPLLSSI